MRRAVIVPTLLTAVLAALTVACGGADVTVDEEDSGGSVELEVGQTLEVSLEENPTTGFAWNLTEAPDPAVIAPMDDDFEGDDPDSEGAGGTRTLLYEAVGQGETAMLLEYYFQTESEDVNQTFTLTVTVEP
jgi:inhibitor of cysteine peptidase